MQAVIVRSSYQYNCYSIEGRGSLTIKITYKSYSIHKHTLAYTHTHILLKQNLAVPNIWLYIAVSNLPCSGTIPRSSVTHSSCTLLFHSKLTHKSGPSLKSLVKKKNIEYISQKGIYERKKNISRQYKSIMKCEKHEFYSRQEVTNHHISRYIR